MLRQLDLSIWPGEKVDFHELLMALHRNARDKQLGNDELKILNMRPEDITLHLKQRVANKNMKMLDKIKLKNAKFDRSSVSLSEHYASKRIGQMFRKWRNHLNYSGSKSPHEQLVELIKSPVEKSKKLKHDVELDGKELNELLKEISDIEQRISANDTVVEVKRRKSSQKKAQSAL